MSNHPLPVSGPVARPVAPSKHRPQSAEPGPVPPRGRGGNQGAQTLAQRQLRSTVQDGWGFHDDATKYHQIEVQGDDQTQVPDKFGVAPYQFQSPVDAEPLPASIVDEPEAREIDDGGWGSVLNQVSLPPFHASRAQAALRATTQGRAPQLPPASAPQADESGDKSSGIVSSPLTTNVRLAGKQTTLSQKRPGHLQMNASPFVQRSISGAFNIMSQDQKRSDVLPVDQSSADSANLAALTPSLDVKTAIVSIHHGPNKVSARAQEAGRRDANRIAVPNPRQWGKAASPENDGRYDDPHQPSISPNHNSNPPSHTQLSWENFGSAHKAGWDEEERIPKWANEIAPIAPQDVEESAASVFENSVNELVSRPDSAVDPPPPVVVEYSAVEDNHTPALTPHGSNSPAQEPEEVTDPAIGINKQKAPAILDIDGLKGEPVRSLSPEGTQTTGRGASHRGRKYDRGRYGPGWWKKPPHPMYSPRFASQRLLVQFPSPIRIDQLRQTMYDHFSRWGPVRAVFHYEPNGEYCEKAFVVFKDPESVPQVLADPSALKCHFRSGSHVSGSELDLVIRQFSANDLSRTILIRLTGPRADQKARSAFPSPAAQEEREPLNPYHTSVLPPNLIIDAIPSQGRDNRIQWWARIRQPNQSFKVVADRARYETKRTPETIGEVDMRRRVPEKDIVPKLCEYFADVCDIYPPTTRGQGWLVTVGGPQEARQLMNELQRIPGFFVRWAHEGDGHRRSEGSEAAPSTTAGEPVSPVTRVRNEMEGRLSRPSRRAQNTNTPILPPRLQAHSQEASFASPSITGRLPMPIMDAIPAPPSGGAPNVIVQPDTQHMPGDSGYSPTHPYLRRMIIHTYKGRILSEDMSFGEPRYVDERAVFVGRLVKGTETTSSLLQRFSKYGKINNIEYKPTISTATYATARVLFEFKEAADRAMAMENGQISFGSAIKVEVRKVLPSDVHTKETYIDDMGRAISPSMVSQYSPKSAPIPSAATESLPEPMPSAPIPPAPFGYPNHPFWPMLPPPPFQMGYPPTAHPGPPNVQHAYPPMLVHSMPQPMASLSPSSQYPMLCAAWGIGYLPAGGPPLMQYAPQQPVPTPPMTPGGPQPSFQPPGPMPAPAPQFTPGPSPPSNPSTLEIPERLSSKGKLNPIGFKEEGGMTKAIYDPEELKAYCEEAGLSPPPAKPTEGSRRDQEVLELLPIATGGHDSKNSRRASVANVHRPIHQEAPIRRMRSDHSLRSKRAGPQQDTKPDVNLVPVPIPFSPGTSSQQHTLPFSPHGGFAQVPTHPLLKSVSHLTSGQPQLDRINTPQDGPSGTELWAEEAISPLMPFNGQSKWGDRAENVQMGWKGRPNSTGQDKWGDMGFRGSQDRWSANGRKRRGGSGTGRM